jgi:very-short-patch-repair endonuclease
MGWESAFEQLHQIVLSSTELIALGATSHSLTAAVRGGYLIRARRDHYVLPGTQRSVVEAVRVGGRVTCVSRLALAGIFVEDAHFTHIHMVETMSRARSPRSRHIPLSPHNRHGAELHWWPLSEQPHRALVSIPDALAHSLRCQPPSRALASIDNALFQGFIVRDQVPAIFHAVPRSLAWLEEHVDGRAEAGQETVLRMIVRSAGLRCEPQVDVPGVGRVDMIVEGCLVVEADSRLAHDGWEHHVADRRRDLRLATLGFMSLRPAYQHTMHEPDLVRSAIANLIAEHRQFGQSASSSRSKSRLP